MIHTCSTGTLLLFENIEPRAAPETDLGDIVTEQCITQTIGNFIEPGLNGTSQKPFFRVISYHQPAAELKIKGRAGSAFFFIAV